MCEAIFLVTVAIVVFILVKRDEASYARWGETLIERGGYPVTDTRFYTGGLLKEVGKSVPATKLIEKRLYVLKRSVLLWDKQWKLMARTIIMYRGMSGEYYIFNWYNEEEDRDVTFDPHPEWPDDEPYHYTESKHRGEDDYIWSFGLTANEVEKKVVDVGLRDKSPEWDPEYLALMSAGNNGKNLYEAYFDEERGIYRMTKKE